MTYEAPPRGGFLSGLSPRNRVLLIMLLVLALLVVAFVLLSGGGSEEPDAFPTRTTRATPRTTASATPTASAVPTTFPETDEAFEGKDPFEPLVTADTGGPGGESPGPTPTATSTTSTGDGGETKRVSLDDIFTEDGTRFATVTVDDEQFTVKEGDTFAGNFRLLDLGSNCGTFVFGDERFTLCLGQEVRK
jgi:hypothetical protein